MAQEYIVETQQGAVTIQLLPPPDNPEIRDQIFELGGLLFVAALFIYLAKQLVNLFSVSNDD